MNLRDIDLNLLVALDALLQEANVTRAAARLHISQPAASSALNRCRRMFGDRLLIRARGGMQLTPKALRLRDELRDLLSAVTTLLDIDRQDIRALKQVVRLSVADSLGLELATTLYEHLSRDAPGVHVHFHPWSGPGEALDQVMRGDIDLAISQFPQAFAAIERRTLATDSYEAIMGSQHPLAGKAQLGLEEWLGWPHLMVSARGESSSSIDTRLANLGLSRRVAMVVPTFLMVPPILCKSDLIALMPQGTVPQEQSGQLVAFPSPVGDEHYDLHMIWHRRLNGDPALSYLRMRIEEHFSGAPPWTGSAGA